MSRGYKHTTYDCSKQCAKSQMQKVWIKNLSTTYVGLLKRKFRAQPLQLNLKELTCVVHQMCAAIPQQYIHRHMLSTSARYLNSCRCDVESIETTLNTT